LDNVTPPLPGPSAGVLALVALLGGSVRELDRVKASVAPCPKMLPEGNLGVGVAEPDMLVQAEAKLAA
jgi:hypothetical protein